MIPPSPGRVVATILFANEREGPAIEEQPQVDVRCWRLYETKSGALHLMMYMDAVVMRVTSELAAIYIPERRLVTSSGRSYALQGPPESDDAIQAALMANAARVGLGEVKDVSNWLWSQMPQAL